METAMATSDSFKNHVEENAGRLKIEWTPIDQLRANPRNARTHAKRQIAMLAASLGTYGFTTPIIVDESGMILAGHGRGQAAKREGWAQVPIVRLDHLSAAEKRAYAIADNKIAQEAGWDRELLAIELGELADLLPAEGLEVALTGFEAAEIDLLLADMGEANAEPEDAILIRRRTR
jgi:ParB-like chromosome segregation protein Spo0J